MEDKILFALDKVFSISRVLIWKNNISPLQFQILLYLKNHPKNFNTVKNLSMELNEKKPTISRTLNILIKKGYVQRIKINKREVYFILTKKGEKLINSEFELQEILKPLNESEKIILYKTLLKILKYAYQRGFISIVRSCFTCRFFNNYYCEFLKIPLVDNELKVDCKDWQAV
ncbi:MAG: MarR family transcriptional regulator [candidate division WOR-3 bacterium]